VSQKEKNSVRAFFALECTERSVKLIEMTALGSEFKLVRAEAIQLGEARDPAGHERALKEAVKKIFEDKDIRFATRLLVVNSPLTYFTQYVIPQVPEKEAAEILKWKLKDEIPFPLEEAVIDYRLSRIAHSDKELHSSALVAATPRSAIDSLINILAQVGLPPFVPVQAIFTVMALPKTFEMDTRQLVAVLDVGESMTEVAFYTKGKLAFLRKISFGSSLLTEALMGRLASDQGFISLSAFEAEQVKREHNLFDSLDQASIFNKISISKLYALIRPELEKLILELRRSLDYYTQSQREGIERIYLTGEGSDQKGLVNFLEYEMNVPTKRVYFEQEIKTDVPLKQNFSQYHRLVAAVLDSGVLEDSFGTQLIRTLAKRVHGWSYQKVGLVSCLIVASIYGSLFFHAQNIHQKTIRLKKEIENLEPGYQYAQKLGHIEKKIASVKLLSERIFEREPSWIEVFREISHQIPKETTLNTVSYQQHALVLTGNILQGGSEKTVASVLESLEGPVFKKVSLVSVEKNSAQKSAAFTIRCEVA